MIYILLALAILTAANTTPLTAAEREPETGPDPKQEVTEVIESTGNEKGWYLRTGTGWIFRPDSELGVKSPPRVELDALMNSEIAQSFGGLLLIVIPVLLVWNVLSRRKAKRRGGTQKGNDMTDVQYQALMRQLSAMARILNNVTDTTTDDHANASKMVRGRRRR